MQQFSEATQTWFEASFAAPTPAQTGAWEAISAGKHALVVAPTGSGKTLSAFLWSLDQLFTATPPATRQERCRVLYISPLKALAVDVERNLRAPLAGIRHTAARLGQELPEVRVGVRSGDTSAADRRRIQTAPPDILITTPESLFLMLTSQAREALRGVQTVIIDEVHAVAGGKRGAHLALSLERLDALLARPVQRVGLSATVRPIEEVARYLGGAAPVEVVAPGSTKKWDLKVVVPVEDLTALDAEERGSIWPAVEERVVDLIEQHRSTIVFANSRRLAERLTARLNEIAAERAGEQTTGAPPAVMMGQAGASEAHPRPNSTIPRPKSTIARAHHGSVSKEQRAVVEDELKRGLLPAVVATSSLELGIDMGAVDLVIQIESPPSIASALQRVGRAGHQVGEVSRGVLFPKHRGDLVPTAVSVQRMRTGGIEALKVPANPLDVLAQQIVAITAMDAWNADELFDLVRRAAPYVVLPRSAFDATLDLLSGRYPSDEFAELRPRIVWDRLTGEIAARPGAQRLAVTSGGTIPDRGLFGVFLVGEKASRVGELDEEMVYESRVGDVFTLGTSSWRIEDITHDRVLVSPAPGVPGRLPFWTGDTMGRPAELGAAIGEFTREAAALNSQQATAKAAACGLDDWAADNLVGLLDEQRQATGVVPNDRQIVVERFRDELGDWRLVVHSPYGTPVHAPWALAINARLRERYGVDAQAMAADDGIVVRIPETDQEPPGAELIAFEPDEIQDLVTTEVGGSALFASRFRECAARALLLPRRDPGRRSPLWQQRQRSAQLLQVAARYPSFPIILETVREVLQDVYDVPALIGLQQRITQREITLHDVATQRPSPFAQSLLFGYVAAFMYEGDSPIAERRAAALTLDQGLLAELLGRAELRELLDPDVLAEVESELQRLAEDRRARDAEGVVDLLRILGPLSRDEIAQRTTGDIDLAGLERRVVEVRIAGEERLAIIEDVSRLRDGLGVPIPPGTAEVFTEPVEDPLGDLIGRYARTHGPFTADEVAARLGLGIAVVAQTLQRLSAQGRVVDGEFRPAGAEMEWCDTEVLRKLRRRSLARLRKEVEPVEPVVLGRFLPAWQHVGGKLRGVDGVAEVIEQLAGCAVPASAWESLVLPSRVVDYQPAMLDELTTTGEVIWAGHGVLPGNDGWLSLHLADSAEWTLPEPSELTMGPAHEKILEALQTGGGFFFDPGWDAEALWDLVWSGRVGNDTLAGVRALVAGRGSHRTKSAAPRTRMRRPDFRSLGGGGSTQRAQGTTGRIQGSSHLAGRWSLLPPIDTDPTRRAKAAAEGLLERHGVLTRGAVQSERVPGGFAGVYKVLAAFEESGRCRRGYVVEGLGAAQFGTAGAIDRLRTFSEPSHEPRVVTLAATDPANPYGAALPWPDRDTERRAERGAERGAGHRPGRKAGALVVLVDGQLALYVERGGKTLLTFTDDEPLALALRALADAVRRGALGRLTIEKADGVGALGNDSVRIALEDAGFVATSKGLRIRA